MTEIKDRMEGAARTVKGIAERGADQARRTTQSAGDWAKEATSGAVEAVEQKVHDAAVGASALVDQATDKAQEWATAVGDAAIHANDKSREWASSVGDAAVHAKDNAQHAASATVEKVEDLAKDMTALIRRYPIQAMLVGLGAGFLLGELLHRPPSKRA